MRLTTWFALGAAALTAACGAQTLHGIEGVGDDAGSDARVDDAAPARDAGSPRADVLRVPTGESCRDAIPVALNSTFSVAAPEPMEPSALRYSGADILAGAFPVRWIRLVVPPRTRVEVSSESAAEAPSFSMFGFSGCTAPDWSVASTPRMNERVTAVDWSGASDAPQDFYVALIGRPPPRGEISLSTVSYPIADNGYCASPRRVIDGTTLPAQDLLYAGERVGTCSPPTPALAMRPALFYRAHLDVGDTLFASSRHTTPGVGRLIGRLDVREACGDTTCLAQSVWGIEGWRRESVYWTNSGPARDVLIAFDAAVGFDEDTATLTFRVAAAPANARCEEASPLPPGVSREANLASALMTDLPCVAPTSRQAAFYTVTVPARATLDVTATAIEGLGDGVAVQVLESCARSMCLAHAEDEVGPSATATWENRGEETTVTVAVTGAHGSGRARTLTRVSARIRP